MPSLSDYFAARQTPAPVAPAPTDAELFAAQDAQSDLAARQATTQASPFIGGLDQGVAGVGTGLTAMRGVLQAAVGNQGDAVATLRRAQQESAANAQYTPTDAGTLSDAYKSGNLGTYAAYKIGSMLPGVAATVIPAAITGGVGGFIGGGLRAGAAEAAGEAAVSGLADAGAAATARQAASSAVTGAAKHVGAQVGEVLGATGAGAVQAAPGQVDNVLNDPGDGSTLQQRALKATAVTAGMGAIQALPSVALMSRYGLGAVAADAVASKVPASLLARVAANAGEQGALGGAAAAGTVALDRAAHAWITGSPAATPALPDYINGIADGALGGAVLGAPAGFKGERSVSDTMRAATNKIGDAIDSYAKPNPNAPKPGEPVNPDGTAQAKPAQTQFDDNLDALKNSDDQHYADLLSSTQPYNVKNDGTMTTLNGPASGLIDPSRLTTRDASYNEFFSTPTQKTVASMLDDDQYTAQAVPGVKAAAKAVQDGWSNLSAPDKKTTADFVNNILNPDQAAKFKRVLATVDAMDPDTKARVDFAKSGADLTDTQATPGLAGADPAAEQSLGYVDDATYQKAQFFAKKGGAKRNTPDNENVTLNKGDGAPVDFNIKQAASSLAAAPEGKALLSGGGDRKLTALLGVQAEALARGHTIDPATIRPGLRVFPGEDGVLSPMDARVAREAMTRQAKVHAPIEETPGEAHPTQSFNPQTDTGADTPVRDPATGVTTRPTTEKNTAIGDISGAVDKQNNPLDVSNLKQSSAAEPRQIENTAVRAAQRLGMPTQKAGGGTRNVTDLYEDALHMGDNGNTRLIKSSTRQLAETDPVVRQRMEEADQRKQLSDAAGERITGDNGAQIPYLKALADGHEPTAAQRTAYDAIRERTDDFAGATDKQAVYADSLTKRIDPDKLAPGDLHQDAGVVSPEDYAAAQARIEAQARGMHNEEQPETKKDTFGSVTKEIADADQYARNPPEDFTAANARALETRMRELSQRARDTRDQVGEDHPRYQDYDDVRMNAKDAADALREVAKQQDAAEATHPDWFDKDVPVAEQEGPKGGGIREAIAAIKKLPEWKAVGKLIESLQTKRTKSDLIKETQLTRTLSKMFGVSDVIVTDGDGKHAGGYSADGKLIQIDPALKGAARISTLLHEFGHHIVSEKFAGASDATKEALRTEYEAWRAKQGSKADSLDVRASRAPLFTSLRLLDRVGNASTKRMDEVSPETAKYLLSAHEFYADSIARALEEHEGAQTAVNRFFSKVAQVTKLAYDLVRGTRSDLVEPPSAVRDWVHSLYEAPAEPAAADAPQATASGSAPNTAGHTADDVSSALSPEDRGLLYKVFYRRDMMQQLLTGADKKTADALGTFGTQMKTAINVGFNKWMTGELDLTDRSMFAPMNKLKEAIKTVFSIPTDKELVTRILNDAGARNTDMSRITRQVLQKEKTAALQARGADTMVAARKAMFGVAEFAHLKAKPVAARFIQSLDERMRDSHIPALHMLASIVHRQTGERGEGQPVLQAIQQKRAQFWDRASKIIGMIPKEAQAAVLDALRSKSTLEDPALDAHRQNVLSFFKDMAAYQRDKGVDMGHIDDYFPVVMDPKEVEGRSEEFMAMLSEPKLEDGMRAYFKNVLGWKDADQMSQMEMIEHMYQMARYKYDYSRGGESYDRTGAEEDPITAGIHQPSGRPHVQPRVSEFVYRQNDPVLNKQLASFQTKDLEQVMLPYVSHATKRAEFQNALGKTGDMKTATLEQLLSQAKTQGATDAHIQMAKDYVNAAMGSYAPGLNPFFAKAIGAFDNVFKTKLGDMNSNQYRNLSNAIMAYQNLRVLGLGLMGNLIDPMGVWTRSSSAGQTWTGYKAAYKAMMAKNPTYLKDMATSLGAVESHATTEALAYNYGQAEGDNINGWSQRVNRALFKVNGMEMVTNFARLAATETGNKFLLAHAQGKNAHSTRYLQELGLSADDIKEDPQHPGYVQRNDKVDKALYQFVNESVLRPVATQKPLWHSDPHFAVAAQYKGYLYAFYSTITERMIHEVQQGNLTGVAPVAGYLAVTMAAELARELVQFGPGGNPNRDKWGAGEYLKLAADRSGLAGPKLDTGLGSVDDVLHGSVPLSSVTGPSVSQAQQLGHAFLGRGSEKNALIESLPGQSLYHGWIEGKDKHSPAPPAQEDDNEQ